MKPNPLTPAMLRALALIARRDAGEEPDMSGVAIQTSLALKRRGLVQPHARFPHIAVLSDAGREALA